MKKFLSVIITGVFGFTILAAASTAYANSGNTKYNYSQNKKIEYVKKSDDKKHEYKKVPKPAKIQNLVAFIKSVDTSAQKINVFRWKDKSIGASKAVVIILNSDGAKVGMLSDLKTGYKATFWVKKTDVSGMPYDAVLVLQDLTSNPVSWPTNTTTPSVKFSSSSGNGLESVTPVSIPVTLSAAADKDVTVAYAVTGTASGSGVDFTLANGTLTIPKGQTTASLSLVVADDTTDELDETVIVTLSSPSNAVLGDTKVFTYTIKDNDQPTVGFGSASGSALENVASVAIPVTLSKVSAHDVTVKYAVTGTATGGGVDYTLANGTLTFPAGTTSKDITLAVVDDTSDESDETVVITLSEPTSATLGSGTVFTQTVIDND